MSKKIVPLLLIPLIITGCWDKVEIEERAHVSAVGIDKYIAESEDSNTRNNFVFTFSFPEHQKEKPKDIVVSTVGDTLYSVSKIMADRSNKELFLGHLRTVIISHDVIKDERAFRQILDGIENNELLSRRVILAMTEDSASEIIKIVPATENMLGEFVSEIFRRRDKIPRTVGRSIGDTLRDLHENGNTIIAKIMPGKADVKIAGAGIIGNFQFRGWLGEVDTAYLLVLRGDTKRLSGMAVQHENHITPVDIRLERPKVKLIEDRKKIKILIEIKMEGDVKQSYFESDEDMLEDKTVKEVEELITETIKEKLYSSIYQIQKEFRTDVIGIDRYLRQSHHRLWKAVEEDWEEIFPNIDINVAVDMKIRRIGLVK